MKQPILLVSIILAAGLEFSARGAQHPDCQTTGILAQRVDSYAVDGMTVIDGVMQLAQQAHIPLGIEYANPDDMSVRVSLNLRSPTVGEALEAILPSGKGYVVCGLDGVVHITNTNVPPRDKNALDRVLREFSIPRASGLVTVVMASNLLRMELKRSLQPAPSQAATGPVGIVGSLPVGRVENKIGPLSLHNVTVRKVLDRLVSEHNNSAWLVVVPPERLEHPPSGSPSLNVNDLWLILEYDVSPPRWSDGLLSLLRQNWSRRFRSEEPQRPTRGF
ncbi:MAG: hypothetical protein LAO07_11395 [Acidobacteriia bacterium]|nr:hypothetical protein [Terriglobia bacterium]